MASHQGDSDREGPLSFSENNAERETSYLGKEKSETENGHTHLEKDPGPESYRKGGEQGHPRRQGKGNPLRPEKPSCSTAAAARGGKEKKRRNSCWFQEDGRREKLL